MADETTAERVPMPGHLTVPRRFAGYAYVDQGDGRPWVNIDMDVEVVAGGAVVHEIRISGNPDPSPSTQPNVALDPEALGRVNLVRALYEAITYEALLSSEAVDELRSAHGHREAVQAWTRRWSEAASSVDTIRRRRQVTPELLRQVLGAYDRGGIAAVQDLGYSESYGFKLLRRARQEVTA
jgi:hypothetical protein